MHFGTLPYAHFSWFRQLLLDNMGEFECEGLTKQQFASRYMAWAIDHGFLHTFGTPLPVAGILFRRVNDLQLEEIHSRYHETLFEFDPNGKVLWIDFMHAPGNYPFMMNFISQLGADRLAWYHGKREQYQTIPIRHLHKVTPLFGTEKESPDKLEPLVINQL